MDKFELTRYYEEPKEKYNIISVSIFQMSQGYKGIKKYTEGLDNLIDKYDLFLPNFYLRIYYDETIDNVNWDYVLNKARKHKFCQLIKFSHPWFKSEKGHYGVFGTLARSIPIFEENKN